MRRSSSTSWSRAGTTRNGAITSSKGSNWGSTSSTGCTATSRRTPLDESRDLQVRRKRLALSRAVAIPVHTGHGLARRKEDQERGEPRAGQRALYRVPGPADSGFAIGVLCVGRCHARLAFRTSLCLVGAGLRGRCRHLAAGETSRHGDRLAPVPLRYFLVVQGALRSV